jgi:glycosyltransferase involved in cell wall biosynthesis
MKIVDAIYVVDGGGKGLLKLLISYINNSDTEVYFLIDKRLQFDIFFNEFNCIFISSSIHDRFIFYHENRSKISLVLCFGNIPPLIKMNCPVYTYFHQLNFLKSHKIFPFKTRVLNFLKFVYIYVFRKNTYYWIVQTHLMSDLLASKLNISQSNVLTLPFFKNLSLLNNVEAGFKSKLKAFVYVSSGAYHKNHKTLLEAFLLFSAKNPEWELHITIHNDFKDLVSLIQNYNILCNNKIINHGNLNSCQIDELYSKIYYVIYPSLSESFGLPLIEAAQRQKIILSSDLDYVYEVIVPSAVFDPCDKFSIYNSMVKCVNENLSPSRLLLESEIDTLVNIIKNASA